MRGGGGGSKKRERGSTVHCRCPKRVGCEEMLRGGLGDVFPEHTQNPVGRCFLDSLGKTRILSGLRSLKFSRCHVSLNTEGESGVPFSDIQKTKGSTLVRFRKVRFLIHEVFS